MNVSFLLYLCRFVKKSVGFGHIHIDTHWVLSLKVWRGACYLDLLILFVQDWANDICVGALAKISSSLGSFSEDEEKNL